MAEGSKHRFFYAFKIIVILFIVFLVLDNSLFLFQSSSLFKKAILEKDFNHNEPKNGTSSPTAAENLRVTSNDSLPPAGYLVWNKHCRMPDVDPFTKDALKIFKKKTYTSCSNELPLTRIVFDINLRTYNLHIDKKAESKLIGNNDDVSCCYQSIIRSGSGNRVDKDFKLKDCVTFKNGDVVSQDVDSFIVSCKSAKKKVVQQDAFYLIREKPEVRERLKSFENNSIISKRPVSVLMLGIDSMSKFNLRRVMPETTAKLLKDRWFELSGYNKSSSLFKKAILEKYFNHNEPKNGTSSPTAAENLQVTSNDLLPPAGYLVWNKHCRMPDVDVDPFTKDELKIFKKKAYTSCSNELPLTRIVFDTNLRTYNLHIDKDAESKLIGNNDDVSCCYQSIIRSGSGNRVDKDFKLKDCVTFKNGDVVSQDVDSFIVSCKSAKKKIVQQDAFYLIHEKPEVRERLKSFENNSTISKRPVSVLMLGIDSMSKFNLRRVMPETTAKLLKGRWFELSGYNKVADNTFPNLMAFLTGKNKTTADSKCNPKTRNGLDNCNMIWDLFRKNGYVTGYAEDETWMSTFNFNKKGFNKIPVDYYQRPFMLAIEKTLEKKKQSGMTFCLGLRHSAEYIYDFALELATRYKSEPYFGLFWANTFSHNSFSDASSMDTRIARYIDEMKDRGILDESIVILFSDHGMRFGPLRNLRQGFLEERLPFIFIWLPEWFRAKHPSFANALKLNKHRLTNPYDLHMTLKHIIELSGRTSKLPQAEDCAKCQSLFYPVPEQRSCKDIDIDEHWCTCIPYENVNKKSKIVLDGINVVLKHLNSYLEKGKFFPQCTVLKLKSVEDAKKRYDFDVEPSNTKDNLEHYRIKFSVPKGKLSASFTYSKTLKNYELVDSVSRLDAYKEGSECIEDGDAKKYCICDKEYNKKLNESKIIKANKAKQ